MRHFTQANREHVGLATFILERETQKKKKASESGCEFLLYIYLQNKYGKLFGEIVPSISLFFWV